MNVVDQQRRQVSCGATPDHPAISFADVSKRFPVEQGGLLEVLRDVSFDVPAGAIVAIVGPSGAGKSTLLNLASGLIYPDHGAVWILAQKTQDRVDWSCVGYMFQDDRLLPWRVALDNVALALEAGSMPAVERRERSRTALALVGLEQFAGAYPHQLSGGMRSRVASANPICC
jgi:ABC-type nitrate/sulfonate/bicarbonate transport system ATPase subunit